MFEIYYVLVENHNINTISSIIDLISRQNLPFFYSQLKISDSGLSSPFKWQTSARLPETYWKKLTLVLKTIRFSINAACIILTNFTSFVKKLPMLLK